MEALPGGLGRNRRIDPFVYELFPVLQEFLHRKGGDLSGGQQQQLAMRFSRGGRLLELGLCEAVSRTRSRIRRDPRKSARSRDDWSMFCLTTASGMAWRGMAFHHNACVVQIYTVPVAMAAGFALLVYASYKSLNTAQIRLIMEDHSPSWVTELQQRGLLLPFSEVVVRSTCGMSHC